MRASTHRIGMNKIVRYNFLSSKDIISCRKVKGFCPLSILSRTALADLTVEKYIARNAMMISTVEVTVGLTNPSADTANNTGFTLSALYIKSTFVC